MSWRKLPLRALAILTFVSFSIGNQILGQCWTVNINCTTCQTGLCWGCGQSDSMQVWPDYSVACNYTEYYCYYCWTGCSSPYHMCQQITLMGIHRCEGDPEYQTFYSPICCNYCGY